MATHTRRNLWLGIPGRLLPAVRTAAPAFAGTLACVAWMALATPNSGLLGGLVGYGDGNIAISLQSALLGIDDGAGRPPVGVAEAAARTLGLSTPNLLLPVAELSQLDVAPAPPSSELVTHSGPSLEPPASAQAAQTELPAASAAFSGPEPGPISSPAASPPSPPHAPTPPPHPASPPPALPPPAADPPIAPAPVPPPASPPPAPAGPPAPPLVPGPSAQTIAFTSAAPSGAVVGVVTYTVTAAATSGLPVSFSADASSAGVCTVSGATVTFVGVGICTIDGDQAGNGGYLAAPTVQQSFAVGSGAPSASPQTITFTSTPPSGAVFGDPAYTVSATATSGLAVSFSADSSSAGVCTVSGSTVTIVGAGTCVVNADQPGNGSYQAAPQAQQSFVAGPAAQTITFTSAAPGAATAGGATYTVAATASSGLAVTFSAAASSAGVCSVSGSTVTFVGAGTCTIDADQAGNGNYQAAPRAQQWFAVAAAAPSPQTITFTSTAPSSATVGVVTYTVTATASSGLAVAFSADASSAGVCTVSGSTVTFVGAGTCTIDANQAGNGSYQAAPQAQQSFAVASAAPAPQTISFTSTAPAGATTGGATYAVSATASSGLAVAFSADATSAGVCTVSGSTVSFVGAGTCRVDANQAGNGSYQAAPQAQQSFAVAAAAPSPQTITFTSSAPSSAVVGGSTYTVSATASSGLAVAFSADASSAGVCTVSGSTVSFVGAGTCTIDANQAGNGSYQAAPQAQQSFAVTLKLAQTITFTSTPPPNVKDKDPPYTVSATASSGLTVTFSAAPGSVCTVSGSTVSFPAGGVGNCTINANQAGDGTYQPAPQVQQSFTVH